MERHAHMPPQQLPAAVDQSDHQLELCRSSTGRCHRCIGAFSLPPANPVVLRFARNLNSQIRQPLHLGSGLQPRLGDDAESGSEERVAYSPGKSNI